MKLYNKKVFKRYTRRNLYIQLILVLIFIIGIIIGSVVSIKLNENKSLELVDFLFWNPAKFRYNELEYNKAFLKAVVHNVYLIFLIYLFGLFNLGIVLVPAVLSTFGAIIGFLVGFFIKIFGFKGFIFSTLIFFPKLIIKLPIIFTIATFSMTNTIFTPKKINLKNNLEQLLIVLILKFFLIIAISLFEGILIKFIINNFKI